MNSDQTSQETDRRQGQPLGADLARQLPDWLPICVGYGCYLSYFPIGTVGSVALSALSSSWIVILLAQMLFVVSTAATLLVLRSRHIRNLLTAHRRSCAIAQVATLACVVAQYGLAALTDGEPWPVPVFSLLLGIATALPKMGWYEQFLLVYRARGRKSCVSVIAGAFLVAAAMTLLTVPMRMSGGLSMAVVVFSLVVSAGCQWLASVGGTDGTGQGVTGSSGSRYRATPYSMAVLMGFGASWALTYNVAVSVGLGGTGSPMHVRIGIVVVGTAVCLALVMLLRRTGDGSGPQFSLLIRWVLVIAGSVWAFAPLLAQRSAPVFASLCVLVFIVQSIAMILFSIEVCHEHGLIMCEVAPINYGVFAAASVVGTAVYWIALRYLDARTAYEVMAAVAVVASLAPVPMLPSRSSGATVFTLDELPEDEVYDGRVISSSKALVERYGLSNREEEVLALLVRGEKRDRIAEELCISQWTVKDHVASIYAKVGVHSAKELMVLVAGGTVEREG